MRSQVYALIDPRDDVVRYIGQSFRPRDRLTRHMMLAQWRGGLDVRPVSVWIRELGATGLKPVLEIIDSEPDLEAEERWIGAFQRSKNGHLLCNVIVPDEEETLRRVLAWAGARGKDRHFYGGKYWRRLGDEGWLSEPHPKQRLA